MRRVKYEGKASNIGRFGNVKKGDVLELTEMEWSDIRAEAHFQLIDQPLSKEEREIAARIAPWGNGYFDLRTIPWENPNLPRQLLARAPKTRLVSILDAVKQNGGTVAEGYREMGERLWLVDAVMAAATLHGWTELTMEQRTNLPTFEERKTNTTTDLPATRDRRKK